jgi:peptidoglycan hydrolase-like protein with peptidoglycan-binding domain
MNPRLLLTTLLIPAAALAAEQQPQEAQQQPQAQQPEAGRYTELNRRVQEALRQRGFYDGPVNGEIGPNTQAALAQFQLSLPMPVSGMLDDSTLAALGVEQPTSATAGGSAEAAAAAQPVAQDSEASTNRPLGGTCDKLIGPEKDRCLQQGGTVEASTNASTGETAPATPKEK